MFNVFALTKQLWLRLLQPIYQRLIVRVSKQGMLFIGLWTALIILFNFISLLLLVKTDYTLLSNILLISKWLLILLTIILWLAIIIDYIWLIRLTGNNIQSFTYQLFIDRKINNNLPVHTWSNVTLIINQQKIHNNIILTIMDNYPTITQVRYLPVTIQQQSPDKNYEIHYQLYPVKRGYGEFAGIDILLTTKLGLLKKFIHIPEQQIQGTHDIRVLANFSQIIQGYLFGVSQKSIITGMLKQQRQGKGQDFHQIRNYIEGDNIRHIDWKATSRQNRLMTKEFQDERDQQILFLLDCGQHMRHVQFFDEALSLQQTQYQQQGSHLDQALNTMLLLAEVANRQGDATGFISFASQNDKIVPPKKGQKVISYLLNQSFDIQPSLLLPDYIAVARTVRSIQKKRSLIILITNTRHEGHYELSEALKLLSSKHIVILANLYEQDLKNHLEKLPDNEQKALTYHSVQEYLNMRENLHKQLTEQTHVYPFNCTPEQLPSILIHHYLKIKQRYRL